MDRARDVLPRSQKKKIYGNRVMAGGMACLLSAGGCNSGCNCLSAGNNDSGQMRIVLYPFERGEGGNRVQTCRFELNSQIRVTIR